MEKHHQEIVAFHNKYKGFHVLFMGFKDDNFFKQAFLLVFVIRVVIFNLIIALLIDFPLI